MSPSTLRLHQIVRWLPSGACDALASSGVDVLHPLTDGRARIPADAAGMALTHRMLDDGDDRRRAGVLDGWPMDAAAVSSFARKPTGWTFVNACPLVLPGADAGRLASRRRVTGPQQRALWAHPHLPLEAVVSLLRFGVPREATHHGRLPVMRLASHAAAALRPELLGELLDATIDRVERAAVWTFAELLDRYDGPDADELSWGWDALSRRLGHFSPGDAPLDADGFRTELAERAELARTDLPEALRYGKLPVAAVRTLPRAELADAFEEVAASGDRIVAGAENLLLALRDDLHDLPWHRVAFVPVELIAWKPPSALIAGASAASDPGLCEFVAARFGGPPELLARLYAGAVSELPAPPAAQLAGWMLGQLGDDRGRWELVGKLVVEGWTGSLEELVSSVCALRP